VQGDESVADVLVEDPICHKLVPKQQAIRLNSQTRNEVVYFAVKNAVTYFLVKKEKVKK